MQYGTECGDHVSAQQILGTVCHAEYFALCKAVLLRRSCKVIVNMQFKVFAVHLYVLQNLGDGMYVQQCRDNCRTDLQRDEKLEKYEELKEEEKTKEEEEQE